MNRILAPLALAAAALLAGCDVAVDFDPYPGATPVSAGSDPEASVDSGTLFAGESVVYRVSGPTTGVPTGSALYIELDEDLEMRVYRTDAPRDVFASSASSAYFTTGTVALDEAADSVEPATIVSPVTCRGSCVALRSAASVYVRITNRTSGDVAYDLYAYVEELKDDGEPGDDQVSGAKALDASSAMTETGAIETLGDVDHYEISDGGVLRLLPNASREVPLVATLIPYDGAPSVAMVVGTSYQVFAGDVIRVRAESDAYAAAPANSSYTLETP